MSTPTDMSTSSSHASNVERNDAVLPTAQQEQRRGPLRFLDGLRAPLRFRDFRLLFAGQLISVVGDQFYFVALPWFVLGHGGAQELGIALTAYGIPRVGTVLLGGALSDRLRPRRVMLVADWARFAILGALAALALVGYPPFWLLCATLALLGAFSGLFIPASWAVAPDLLPDDALQGGNALQLSWGYLAGLIGPVLGGLVVARAQSGPAFAVDALTFLVSAATLTAMRTGGVGTGKPSPSAEAPGADATQAHEAPERSFWRYVRDTRLIQLILVVAIILNLVLNGILEVGLPALAHGPLHASASVYGALVGAFGAGALLGGLSAGLLARVRRPLVVNLLIWAVQGVAILLVGLSGNALGVALALAAQGVCNGLGNVSFFTIVQRIVPRHFTGRFMGMLAFANFGLFPISAALAGFTLPYTGPEALIAGAGALSTLVALLALLSREARNL